MSPDLALDFGTATTRLAGEDGEIVFEEPTLTAVDTDSGRLVAFGRDAMGLGARCAGRVALLRPVRNGQLVDLALAEAVLADALRRSGASRIAHPRVLVCAHVGSTGVQRRAVHRALRKAGARKVRFVEQPVACAIGAELAIEEPTGTMVVDIGGGTTDIAVIALGGVVTSASIPCGGEDFDDAVRDHLVRSHVLVVDRETASDLRRRIGTVATPSPSESLEVVGRDARSGQLRATVVSQAELKDVLDKIVQPILDAAVGCIASAPPDLANDLLGSGLVLAGGGARLGGFARRLALATGVPVHVNEHADRLAVLGAARCLDSLDEIGPAISSAPRR